MYTKIIIFQSEETFIFPSHSNPLFDGKEADTDLHSATPDEGNINGQTRGQDAPS